MEITDTVLAEIYNKANNLDPNRVNSITTARIFRAMRAAIELGTTLTKNEPLVRYELTESQMKKFVEWSSQKPKSNATIGEQFTFSFTPTGLGVATYVKCLVTNDELDLTEYESW